MRIEWLERLRDARRARRRARRAERTAPIQDSFERSVDEAVEYTLACIEGYVGRCLGGLPALAGRRVLEVGPGQDLGMSLVMAGFGAEVVAIDRFLVDWNCDFHPDYYRALRAAAPVRMPGFDTSPLDAVIEAGDHLAPCLTLHRHGLEEAPLADQSIDLSFSMAVFEHLRDPGKAIAELARVTRPGGFGIHQIDCRDHRNFERPLEYLTLPDDEFETLLDAVHCTCGNRVRHSEFLALFEDAGFDVEVEPNLFAEEAYVRDVEGRVQPRYRAMARENLEVLSALFLVTRK